MAFAGMNYLAIIGAAIAGFMFGGAWYGLLGTQWMQAAGLDEKQIKATSSTRPMVIAMVGLIVMAWVLAAAIGYLGPGQVTFSNGLIVALILWTGFVATSLTINYSFQMQSMRLLAIDLGHWLGVLLIQGAIIGLVGV